MKSVQFVFFLTVVLSVNLNSCKNSTSAKLKLPPISDVVKITYPKSNPLREALKPVPETAVFEMEGWSLWDPSIIKVGDTYHLFCSRWKVDEGWDTWKKSHIIRVTSKSLFGPFKFEEIVMEAKDHPWANQGLHNPKITKVGDKFLLYHLAIPQWKTGFMFSENIEGPWKPLPESVLPTNNPSLMIRDDGSVYAVGKFKPKKEDTKDGRWDAYMEAYEASTIFGPFTKVADNNNRLPNNFELEDPTIWWANNQYNVICTDWEAKVTGSEKAVLMYTSVDGINYQLYSQIPIWAREEFVVTKNKNEISLDKVERPQVYINEKGELAALLVSATRNSNKEQGIIIVRPVDNFVPQN